MISVVDSEEHSSEDSEWEGTGHLGPDVLVAASFCCRKLPLEAVSRGPLGSLLGGCEGVVVLLGDWPRDGSWLEVVLGPRPVPEDPGACGEGTGAELEKPVSGWG